MYIKSKHMFHVQDVFFRISCSFRNNVEEYGTAGQDIDDNEAHTHFMLDTYVYRHARARAFPLQNGCTNAPKCYVVVHCLYLGSITNTVCLSNLI